MNRTAVALSTVLGLSLAAASFGQVPTKFDPKLSNFSYRIGGAFSIDQSLNQFSSSYYGVGLDFQLNRALSRSASDYLSVDAFWPTKKGFDKSSFVLTYTEHIYASERARFNSSRGYIVAGLGGIYYGLGDSDIKPAARLGFGVEMGSNFFVETVAILAQQSKDKITGNVIGIYFGSRIN
jgi:hypothetical protein